MKNRLAACFVLLAAGFAAGACVPATGVLAQDLSTGSGQAYPNKPIRLIVPFGAGGGSDYVGRLVGQKLTEQMGQTVVVDNRPGAASLVGTEIAARAAPDGYTLLLADSGFTINSAYYKHVNYDALKDFDPVTVAAETPYLLVVHPNLPYAKSLKDYIAAGALEPAPNTPDEFRKMIANELQRWARVIKDAGIRQE